MQYIQNYFFELFQLTNEMSPYLLLGFFFAGILHVFFKKEKIAKYLGGSKIKSTIYATLIGIPLPLCSCGVIPTGISFYKNGASKGSTVSFLISTPQTGVDSILVTYSLLGLPFAIIRPVIALISGFFGGVFTNLYTQSEVQPATDDVPKPDETKNKENIFSKFFNYAFVEFLQDISKWLIIGLMLAAFIALALPDDFFTAYINNSLLSMGIVLLASIPLYVCATGSVPIAAVLLMKGLSPGAALVFLMAGPATNTATITVLGKVMGKKALTGYLVSIIGFALLFGFFIDYFLPGEWFTSFISIGYSEHSEHGLPYWFQVGSTIVLILLIINGYYKKYGFSLFGKRSNVKSEDHQTTGKSFYTYVKVEGMTCNHCKTNVENAIKQVSGVKQVEVNLGNSITIIKGDNVNPDEIKNCVEAVGYEYGGLVN
ncbi:MAG: permease [Bacteroidota bacterium]